MCWNFTSDFGEATAPMVCIVPVKSRAACRRIFFYCFDQWRDRRFDGHLPRAFSSPAARLRNDSHNVNRQNLAIALDLERNYRALTPHYIPDDAVVHPGEARDRPLIDLENLVSWLQSGFGRR